MSVYVTGDIHGCPTRFGTDIFFEQKEFSGNKDENVGILVLSGIELRKVKKKNIG